MTRGTMLPVTAVPCEWFRGSVSTDLPTNIAKYLKKFPGVLKTFSNTALQDDADFNDETKKNDEKDEKKKKKKERRHRRSASEDGKTQTKTSTAASKWTDTLGKRYKCGCVFLFFEKSCKNIFWHL